MSFWGLFLDPNKTHAPRKYIGVHLGRGTKLGPFTSVVVSKLQNGWPSTVSCRAENAGMVWNIHSYATCAIVGPGQNLFSYWPQPTHVILIFMLSFWVKREIHSNNLYFYQAAYYRSSFLYFPSLDGWEEVVFIWGHYIIYYTIDYMQAPV